MLAALRKNVLRSVFYLFSIMRAFSPGSFLLTHRLTFNVLSVLQESPQRPDSDELLFEDAKIQAVGS